jgi:hypothetical protein
MQNPILKEVRRVTGWHFLIDHEAFPLLLAAMAATNILWFYPGIGRLHAAYFPELHQAAVVRAVPQVAALKVEIIDEMGEVKQDGNMMEEEVEQL